MATRAPRQSAEDWFHIIAEFNRSGLSVEEFCTRRGYAASTFNRWRLRHTTHKNTASVLAPTPRGAFVEALPEDSGTVTISLGESVKMDCPLSLGIDQIARLAKAVATDERA